MTEKLLSYYKVKGFSPLLVCFAVIFCRVMIFIRYIGVDFTSVVLDCVRYIEDFAISRFVISRISLYRGSLYRGFRYIEVRYIEVLFHTFHCNFGRAEEYRSLYRGLRHIEVR